MSSMDVNVEESFRAMGLSDLEYLRTHIDRSDSLDVNVSTPMGEESVHSPAHSKQDDFVPQASVSEDESGEACIQDHEKFILDSEENLSVGKSFEHLDEVYVVYCEYGRIKGFSVRRGDQRYVGKTDVIRWKEYLCSSAGKPDNKSSRNRVPCYKKLITRTDCKAKIRISRISGGGWWVTHFVTEHNHPLVPLEQAYMLRSARYLSFAKSSVVEGLTSFGIGVTTTFRFMEKESGGPQNVGFTRQDVYDHEKRLKRLTKVENADANSLMQHFIDKSNKEPQFFWRVQLDDVGRIMNFYFRDSRSWQDYEAFGDILSVDTTYRTNRYNLICAPFVGINHHTFNVMFGMAFLSDETTETFEWLFSAFLDSMKGVPPKLIFTDQSAPMMKAIDNVFPNSQHRLCQWHINRNAHLHFGALSSDSVFRKLWYKCMNEVETVADFDSTWGEMISSFDLKENSWFSTMHKIRHRWASVFSNDTFCAGLHATSRSECTNHVLKYLLRRSSSLFEIVRNYEIIQNRWRQREIEEDTLSIWTPGQMVNDNSLLSHAAEVYTRHVYKAFEQEVTLSLNVVLTGERVDVGGGNLKLSATTAKGKRIRSVLFNLETHVASCSCKKLETDGIFCRHILKVFFEYNVFAIPQSQISKRWCRFVNSGFERLHPDSQPRPNMPYILYVNDVIRKMYDTVGCAVENESARKLISERVEALQQDVFAIAGKPEVKMKRKLYDMSSGDTWNLFRNPDVIREKVFAREGKKNAGKKKAGNASAATAKKKTSAKSANGSESMKKGIRQKKNTKTAEAEPMPFMPSNFTCNSISTPQSDVEVIPLMQSQISTNSMASPPPRGEQPEPPPHDKQPPI